MPYSEPTLRCRRGFTTHSGQWLRVIITLSFRLHDHGAGGHLNCLSELVEATGGMIDISKLPVGDPTLSAREIIGNESQERMGLVMQEG